MQSRPQQDTPGAGDLIAPWMRAQISIGIIFIAGVIFCAAADNPWIEVRSPHFVVISDASPKQARKTARSLEQFRSLLRTALPKLKVDPGSPLVVFAVRDEKSLKALLPKDQEKTGAAQPAGIFMGSPEKNFVLLRTDVPPSQAYHVVYHEFVHLVLRLNYPELPLWLSEGLAELFGYANISEKTSDLGNVNPELLQVLQTRQMIPLATLLSVTHDSPYYHKQGMVELFYAQSWALTHYLMLGDRQAHVGLLNEFLGLLQNDVPEEQALKQAFGSLKTLEHNLNNYVRLRAFYHFRIPAQLSIKEDQYAVRALSQAESLAARGEVLLHSGRLDEAEAMFEQALQLDPRGPLANEGMGLLFMILGNREQAAKYFALAAELDSRSFLAHYFAAQAAYEGGDHAKAETYLRRSLAINPRFVPACRTLSQLLMMQQGKLAEALEFAKTAAGLEPADLSHRINVSRILIMMGKEDEAYALAERLLAIARTEPERREAESLLFLIKDRKDRLPEEKRGAEVLEEGIQATEGRDHEDNEKRGQLDTQAETWRQAAKASAVKTGPSIKAHGLIRSVKCDYPAIMDLVLESNGTLHKLRAENYYEVRYWAVGAPGKSGFEPCEELEGKRVEIEFLRVSGQEYSGLIKTVAIEK